MLGRLINQYNYLEGAASNPVGAELSIILFSSLERLLWSQTAGVQAPLKFSSTVPGQACGAFDLQTRHLPNSSSIFSLPQHSNFPQKFFS